MSEISIQAELFKQRKIASIWCVEDVLTQRPDLNAEEAWEVLQSVDRHQDASIGINWGVIDSHAVWLFGPRKMFSVIEYSSFFAVRHRPIGEEHPMGDGVDTLFDDGGEALSPGTPGFIERWEQSLNGSEDETMEAYFPHLIDED